MAHMKVKKRKPDEEAEEDEPPKPPPKELVRSDLQLSNVGVKMASTSAASVVLTTEFGKAYTDVVKHRCVD